MKELYNLYINGEFIKSQYIDIAVDEYRGREPPSEISNDDGTIRYVLAEEDEKFMEELS